MRDPQALISSAQLAAALGQPQLRLYDCTTHLEPPAPGSDDPYTVVSGLRTFEEAHIPGADFLDLQGEVSETTTRLRFMMPPSAQLEAAFGRHGLGAGTRVVLYSLGSPMWATRFWWMLKSLGFDDAAVLDGGLDAWKAEARPLERGPARGYPPSTFRARPRPGFFVDKHAVSAATKDPGAVVVNALSPQSFRGEENRYGRPGRVPGSVNVPWTTLVDTGTKTFRPLAEARETFAAQGITGGKPVVAYCGGGISATIDLFVLHQLGYDRLTLYDGSLGEWAKDPALPIETG